MPISTPTPTPKPIPVPIPIPIPVPVPLPIPIPIPAPTAVPITTPTEEHHQTLHTADEFPPALLCRKSQCFVQLLNLLNIDYSHEAGTALCEQVLSTITALMAGSESMKSEMKKTVGYDTLLNIVLRRTAPKGPSAGVLMQVLHLILEVDSIA